MDVAPFVNFSPIAARPAAPIHSRTVPLTANRRSRLSAFALKSLILLPLIVSGCNRYRFPNYPATYREFAYVTNGASGTVTILDLVYLRQDRVLQVGRQPTGLAVNPVRNEVYAANAGSDSISVIDAANSRVAATIGVHRTPYFVAVAPDGKRAYVPNSGSNTVSVIDLDTRREIAVAATGEGPGKALVSPDNRILVVTNRVAGSVSLYTITSDAIHPLQFREAFDGCPGATDAVIEPDDVTHPESGAKVFVACSGGHQVMDIWLGAASGSWRATQDPGTQRDAKLAILDVGKTPTHLTLKATQAQVFCTNFGADSVSEISTWTNEVAQTFPVGSKPSRGVISADDALAPPNSYWVTDFGADSVSLYSTDENRVTTSVHTGSHPDAIAFSADQHLLLVADSGSADVAVIRTQSKDGIPSLVTLLPAGVSPNDIVVKSFHAK